MKTNNIFAPKSKDMTFHHINAKALLDATRKLGQLQKTLFISTAKGEKPKLTLQLDSEKLLNHGKLKFSK